MFMEMTTRRYELRQRAERRSDTHRRILEAIVALHQEIGPARTTISAIAERAGVERLTVYRHFADETAMLEACSAHFAAGAPPPNPAGWSDMADPVERLQTALLGFYDYYRRGENMLAHVRRDASQLPVLAAMLVPWETFVLSVRDGLVAGWETRASPRLATSIAHALRFETWQSLVRIQQLEECDAATLMVDLARAAARDDPSWHTYRDTILEFFPGDEPLRVDLRRPVRETLARQMGARGIGGRFVVVTACNPHGRTVGDAENAARTQALLERLKASELAWLPVDGLSPDGAHREAGVAVAMSRSDAQALARDFGQSAIFTYDGAAFWLVGAFAHAEPERLPGLV